MMTNFYHLKSLDICHYFRYDSLQGICTFLHTVDYYESCTEVVGTTTPPVDSCIQAWMLYNVSCCDWWAVWPDNFIETSKFYNFQKWILAQWHAIQFAYKGKQTRLLCTQRNVLFVIAMGWHCLPLMQCCPLVSNREVHWSIVKVRLQFCPILNIPKKFIKMMKFSLIWSHCWWVIILWVIFDPGLDEVR